MARPFIDIKYSKYSGGWYGVQRTQLNKKQIPDVTDEDWPDLDTAIETARRMGYEPADRATIVRLNRTNGYEGD